MNIDYKNETLQSKTVSFEGETDDGKEFTLCANWNDWDGWGVDEIIWRDEEGTPEEEEAIMEKFVEEA
jgi:hypothetical protein